MCSFSGFAAFLQRTAFFRDSLFNLGVLAIRMAWISLALDAVARWSWYAGTFVYIHGGRYYGKGKSYHAFVGRDATRAFALGCTKESCISEDVEGLTAKQLKEIDRWTELYETHDKYAFVGMLVDDPIDAILASDDAARSAEMSAEAEL